MAQAGGRGWERAVPLPGCRSLCIAIMATGGGFRGVSSAQDARFANKMAKQLKSTKFPKVFITINSACSPLASACSPPACVLQCMHARS